MGFISLDVILEPEIKGPLSEAVAKEFRNAQRTRGRDADIELSTLIERMTTTHPPKTMQTEPDKERSRNNRESQSQQSWESKHYPASYS